MKEQIDLMKENNAFLTEYDFRIRVGKLILLKAMVLSYVAF